MSLSHSLKPGNALRLALAASAIGSVLTTPMVLAQDSPDAEATELAPMLITGSQIPTTDIVGLVPVDVFSQVEIQKIGAASVTEVVRKLPAAVGSGNSNESRGNGGDGAARIALRGIEGGTLVLINGRRVAPVAFADSDVDINMIPIAAIERIEVLKDGASAAYGSDAIAGVVNIIMRKSFEGVELYGYYGNTTERDAAKQQYSFVSGTSSDKGSFVVGGSYYKSHALFSQDRERSRVNVSTRDEGYLNGVRTTISNPGRFRVRNDALGGGGLYDPAAPADRLISVSLNRGAVADPVTGKFRTSDYHLSDASIATIDQSKADPSLEVYPFDKYPYPTFTPAIRPSERYSIFGNGNYRLYGDNLEFFAETLYSHSWTQNQLAPTPMTQGSAGFNIPASNYYNPFGVEVSNWAYRFTELGPRLDTIEKDAFRFVGGLRGRISDTSWGWELATTYSEERGTQEEAGDVNRTLLEQLTALNTPAAFNPFGFNAASPEVVNQVSRTLLTRGKSYLISIDGKVTGEIIELPAGPLAVALGGEHRHESGESLPDDNKRLGDAIGFSGAGILKGSRDIDAGFGEIYIPIFSKENEIPGIYAMNIRGQVRHEEYSDFGGTTKPGVKFGYNPIDDHFTLHFSFAQSFRAPTYADLYTPLQESAPEVRNPYTGAFTQIDSSIIGDPTLKPQEADNILVGAEWRVKQVPGLKVALDYFRIEREGVPGGSSQFVLDQNFQTGGPANAVPNPGYDPTKPIDVGNYPVMPGVNPTPGRFADQIEFDPDSNEYVKVTRYVSLATDDRLDGFDIDVTYDWRTDNLGVFSFGLSAQYLLTYEQQLGPGAGYTDRLGDFSEADEVGYGSLPRLRGYGSFFWRFKDLEAGFYANYTGSYLDDKLVADRPIDSYLTFDIQASYSLPYQTRLTAGCLNVADAMPPRAVGAFSDNYNRDLHDLRQRFWYVSLSKRF